MAVSAPAATACSVENVESDLLHLVHRARPARAHIGRVVVRGRTDLGDENLAGSDSQADLLGNLIMMLAAHARRSALAGERKLAAITPRLVLVDDAADRGRIGRVADAVEDDLGDGCLALHVLAACLEIDAFGKAF